MAQIYPEKTKTKKTNNNNPQIIFFRHKNSALVPSITTNMRSESHMPRLSVCPSVRPSVYMFCLSDIGTKRSYISSVEVTFSFFLCQVIK